MFLFPFCLHLFKQMGDFFPPASYFPFVHLYTYKSTREKVKIYVFSVVNSI